MKKIEAKINVGDYVRIYRMNFGSSYIGRKGRVTSIGKGVIPIHITLEGDNHETDFAKNEVIVCGGD